MRRLSHFAAGAMVFALLCSPSTIHAQSPADLKYFTSFTVTGDYVVAGVDLLPQSQSNGFVTGTIQVTGVPANADIIAAYLYWETIWSNPSQLDGALFRGQPVSAVKSSDVSLIGPYAPCWSNGGNNLTMMRADVRRLLPPQLDAQGKPTGKRVVNHADLLKYQQQFPSDKWVLTVTLPEAGTGNQLPQSAGASLLIVYRNPDPQVGDPPQSLKSIVVYDGVHLQTPGEITIHTLRGFVQSASAGSQAKFTPIVGSGAPNDTDRVSFKSGNGFTLLGTDKFVRTSGGSSDRAWSNPTFPVTLTNMPATSSLPYGEQVQTKVDHASTSPYDCLSWAATVFATDVEDSDGDGIVDQLESTSGLKNPADESFPDLAGMGAVVGQRDLFIEVGAMSNDGTTAPVHSHMPSATVLKMVGEALASPPAGHSPIAAHFDVGPTLGAAYRAALQPTGADRFIIPGPLASGGEVIQEQLYARFPTTPGTVSWPTGYQMYVHAPVAADGSELTPAQVAACFDTGTSSNPGTGVNGCRRRFDKNRQGLFHYALYAHARGIPKSDLPCLDAVGKPAQPGPGGACTLNPDYYVPKSVSGVAELPGRFFMITLGLWDNQVGSEFMQASTTLHELGHNLGLWHGGSAPVFTNATNARATAFVQPNCKPNYFSIMSYVYQATGVVDFTGTPLVRYAAEQVNPVNEAALDDVALTPEQLFRPAWYTPLLPGTLGQVLGLHPATKHCNGTPLFLDSNGQPTELPMGRIDAGSPIAPIDWNGTNGVYPAGKASLDINFDGVESGNAAVLVSFNDWAGLRLNQAGAGRNMAGMSLGLDFGGLDFGGLDFGGLDFGGLDFGGLDFGGLGYGGLDFGGLDFGGLDFGGLDFGGLDFGGLGSAGLDFGGLDFGGLDFGGLDFGGAELDYATIIESGGTPPTQMTACVLGGTTGSPVCAESVPLHRNKLAWQAPNAGTVDSYRARRAFDPSGIAVSPSASSTIDAVPTVSGATTIVDNEELPDRGRFLYFTQGVIAGTPSGPSNFAVLTAENAAPVASNDDFTTVAGTVVTGNVLSNDSDNDSPASSLRVVLKTQASNGVVALQSDGSFTYTPNPGFGGTDSFTYVANNGTWRSTGIPLSADSVPATVTIHVQDSTPPLVVLSIPAPTGNNGYFKTRPVASTVSATDGSNVVAFACTANGSAVAVTAPSGLGTPSASATVSLNADGNFNLVCVATDGAGNSGAAPGSTNTGVVKIDTTPPTVAITAPANDAAYILNVAAASSYGCSDPGGSGVNSCVGPVASGSNFSASPVGSKMFTVTASDKAGNMANVSSTYYVRYNAVIDPAKASNLGSAIPLTWQLKDANGVNIVRLTTLIRLWSVFNGPRTGSSCTATNPTGPTVQQYSPATGATGGSDYRLVSSGYKFNWDTTTVSATGRGCYTIIWQFDDNSGAPPGYAVLKDTLRVMRAVEVK